MKSITYKGNVQNRAAEAQAIKRSMTLYTGEATEEKAERTFNYSLDSTIKSTTSFKYDQLDKLNIRLIKSITYRNEVANDAAESSATIKAITTYSGEESEEKAQAAYNFNFDGNRIKTVNKFEYESASDKLFRSTIYRNDINTDDYTQAQLSVKKSVTTYNGDEGEERAKYTYNFNYSGDRIKTVSIFEYDNASDRLIRSAVFRNEINTNDYLKAEMSIRKSITEYVGDENAEKAQRTWNYNFAGDTIKSTTVFEYLNDTLDKSRTYRGKSEALKFTDVDTANVIRSETQYQGNEGEEKAQRTWNYNFAGDTIKSTTIF